RLKAGMDNCFRESRFNSIQFSRGERIAVNLHVVNAFIAQPLPHERRRLWRRRPLLIGEAIADLVRVVRDWSYPAAALFNECTQRRTLAHDMHLPPKPQREDRDGD